MPARNPAGWTWLLPAAIALLWFLPTLSIGCLSDDFLLVYYVDRDAGAVHWERVFGEFVRPWFGVRDLYRPMVSLSLGLNAAVGGVDPAVLHLGNVLFLVVTVAAAAAAAGWLVPGTPRRAALVAGLAVGLHPAAVESTTWIAGRTTALAVMFGMLAWAAFAAHLAGGRARWPVWVWLLLALLSKESAVMLPVALLVVDLVHGGSRSWADRVRLHLPHLVLVLGYLVWRRGLLGYWTTAETGHDIGSRVLSIACQLPLLVGVVDGFGVVHGVVLAGVAALLLLLGWRRGPVLPLLLLAATAVALAPASHVVALAASSGRFVFDAVPMFALALALATAAHRRAAPALVAVVVVGLAWCAWAVMAHYRHAGDQVQAMQREVAAVAAAQPPPAPLALIAMPAASAVPALQDKLLGFLGLRPFQARDLAVVGMPGFLAPDPAAPGLAGDAAPLLAVLAAGGRLGTWQPEQRRFAPMPELLPAAVRVTVTAAAPGHAVVPADLRGAFAVVTVALAQPARSVALRLVGDLPLPGVGAFGEPVCTAPSPASRFVFDVSRRGALLVRAQAGLPPAPFVVTVDGRPAPAGTTVELHAAPLPLPVPQTLAGAVVAVDELPARLPRPTTTLPLRLYILLPTAGASVDVAPDRPLAWTEAARGQLAFAHALLGRHVVRWFWQTLPDHDGPPLRSAIDWCEVR